MYEFNPSGMQANASVRIAALCSILQVSFNRATHFGQLASDLMVASGLQINLQQIVAFRASDDLVGENCFLRILYFAVISIRFVLLFITHQPMHQFTGRGRWLVFDYGPIGLFYFFGFEHFIQAAQSLAGTCKKHQSAYRTVQTVGDSKKYIAGFMIFLLDVLLYGFRQRRITGLVTLHNLRAGLVYQNDMIVFVNDIH